MKINFFGDYKSKNKYYNKRNNKTNTNKQTSGTNKKYFNKNGILVMILIMAVYAVFINNTTGYTLFERMTGKADKMAHQTISAEQAADIKVLIDAGHGGFDNGATSDYVEETESELNLAVAQKLKEELEGIGFQVEMTRSDSNALGENKNADMANREDIIYKSDADVMVSVHMNTHQDKSVNGPIVFYMPGSNKGNELANLVQASMNDELDPENPKNAQSQNFLVLRSGNMPGILVECGFITNKDEAAKLGKDSYQKRIAQSISWGIMDYFAKRA